MLNANKQKPLTVSMFTFFRRPLSELNPFPNYISNISITIGAVLENTLIINSLIAIIRQHSHFRAMLSTAFYDRGYYQFQLWGL